MSLEEEVTIDSLLALNLVSKNSDPNLIMECLEILNDYQFHITPIGKYYSKHSIGAKNLANQWKIKFANDMFAD